MLHPKWLQRHVRHFEEALRGAERGDHRWACYNAYVSVRALLLGLLGRDPYKPDPGLYALAVLLKKVAYPTEEVEKCAKCLEDWEDKPAARCLKCAELIAEALLARAQT
ncbi:MAG: DNA-binding protein [Pyrobaculum sp.]